MIPIENEILKLKTVKYEINFFINYKYKFLNNLYLTYIIFDFWIITMIAKKLIN